MKTIEVVAAIIRKGDKILQLKEDMEISKIGGNSLEAKWKLENLLKQR